MKQFTSHAMICGFVAISTLSQSAHAIPTQIASIYKAQPDATVSDEFNTSTLDTNKWAYRTKYSTENWGTDSSSVYFRDDNGDQYLSLKGTWSDDPAQRVSSGIASKHKTHYGFYETRWRIGGITPSKKTPWHPAIWMASSNFASGNDYRTIGNLQHRLEIDQMELWHNPSWVSHTILWDDINGTGTAVKTHNLRPPNSDFPIIPSWRTMGIEYHPDYVRLWDKGNGTWQLVDEVAFTDDASNTNAMHEKYRTPGYWILSNKDHWNAILASYNGNADLSEFRLENSWFHIDYFRYHQLNNIIGDLDMSGLVDIDDVAILFDHWKTNVAPGDFAAGDLTGDGYVDNDDLMILADNWGANTPPPVSVPEPATFILLGSCAAFLRRQR